MFRTLLGLAAGVIPLLAAGILVLLAVSSMPVLQKTGLFFFVRKEWDPVAEQFGALAFAYGTLMTSFIALVVAAPAGVGIALAITEFAPLKAREWAAWIVETLAAVPSVIFGLWGLFVLAPFLHTYVDPILERVPGGPFFAGPDTGLSLFTAGVVVAIMILPTIMAVCREVFNAVPISLRESALALGSTRWEAVRLAVLAPSLPGIIGAIILGMGRALGETMAVTMVIGNAPQISANLLGPADSLASAIANQFTEATSDMHLSALTALGFLLFGITMVLNIVARLLVWAVARRMQHVAAK
ncbi:MAG TPA: phosphate ABC transporter permease subunit PstC [bacterium]|nr:phosphate ABC transporter permease subunit PstC [bacterium]